MRLKELKAAQTAATKAQVNAQRITDEVTMTPKAAVGVSHPTRTQKQLVNKQPVDAEGWMMESSVIIARS